MFECIHVFILGSYFIFNQFTTQIVIFRCLHFFRSDLLFAHCESLNGKNKISNQNRLEFFRFQEFYLYKTGVLFRIVRKGVSKHLIIKVLFLIITPRSIYKIVTHRCKIRHKYTFVQTLTDFHIMYGINTYLLL